MAGVFHVEFGINDTALTQALEATNYSEAEKLIKNRTVASYLDEGCYQRIPLFIVLCGQNEEMTTATPRNLYLARLLIEYGASVNYRVPETFLGCEYMGPGKTALCLLVDFHIHTSKQTDLLQGAEGGDACDVEDELRVQYYPAQPAVVVGLNKQLLYNTQDILDDIEILIFTLLSNGADPNLTDSSHKTCLHKVSSGGQRVELLKLLADNGANINALDNTLSTPLMSLCDTADIHNISLCEFHENCYECRTMTAEEASRPIPVKPEFLQYFLSRTDTEINTVNVWLQTALFHCVIRGDTEACRNLLRAGADPSIKSMVWFIDDDDRTRQISPLLGAFLSAPVQRGINWTSDKGELRAEAFRRFAHLVDAGYFTTKEITGELMTVIETDFPQFSHFRPMGSQLIHQMAGGTTATLKQLAARTIFKSTLMNKNSEKSCKYQCEKFEASDIDQELGGYEDYINSLLRNDSLRRLITSLSLPRNSLINFEIELFLRCLSIFVGDCQPSPTYNVDSSSVEGDSDLEYW